MHAHRRVLPSLSAVAAVLLAGFTLAVVPAPAGALDLSVTTTTDGGPGSLRAAIDDINGAGAGPHTITLQAGATYTLDQCGVGDNGGLTIANGPLTIEGNGATVRQTCTDARVFRYNATSLLTINDLTVTGGNRTGSSRGAGLKTFGPVSINRSTFTDNHAGGEGGAIWSNDLQVTVSWSTFSGNSSGNTGGAIHSSGGSVVAAQSTFTDNEAVVGGAVYSAAQTYQFVTMVGNRASQQYGALSAEGVDTFGSVFADNTSPGGACGASFPTSDFNWTDDDSCDGGGPDDVLVPGGDPMLGALADNGGPTETMLPAAGSPLLDAIPTAEGGCEGIDQRGVTRPQGPGCDIGSVEVAVEVPVTTSTPATSTTASTMAPGAVVVTPTFTG